MNFPRICITRFLRITRKEASLKFFKHLFGTNLIKDLVSLSSRYPCNSRTCPEQSPRIKSTLFQGNQLENHLQLIPLASPSRSRNSIARCSVVCRFQLEAQESIRANPLLFMANNGTCADDGSVAINSLFYCPRFSMSSSLPLCFNLFNIRRKCFTPKFRQFT